FKGPEEYFTGEVQVDMLFPANDTAHYSGAYVTFAPGARTAWHMHPAGQHMIVTNGTALTGTRNGKVIEFKEGETVWCPSNIDHWHGATPDASMTHLVITGSKDGENVIWKEKVNDKEYNAAVKQTAKEMPSLKALTQKQQRIIPIAAFTANGDQASLKKALQEGLDAGLTINEIKEVQIHLYAYVGFPRSLNGLATFMTVVDERKAKGIKDKIGKEPTALPLDKTSLELGKEVQTELSGRPVTGPLFDFAPGINTFLQSHLFGDLFGRDILDYQSRETATVSALASMDGVDSQLKAHIRIASNVGLTEIQLNEVATVLDMTAGRKAGARVEQAVKQVMHQENNTH
ncbi:MAG: carboxymuconolactone decarboxylase family protein, partial [Thiohalomonadales bacterium]|nr:carboxymuconolactone decarboxylase family protein [Thiohalomonadales bacterium]